MIASLYKIFQPWSATGCVWIVSDTHFDDEDCALMDADWPAPEDQARMIVSKVHKGDTLIHLGDVGDPAYLERAWKAGKRPYLVLISGNHDKISEMGIFDEVYAGPLMIGEKLLLSHEPLDIDWALNIHGHDHADAAFDDDFHMNLAANVIGYEPVRLDEIVKSGRLKAVQSIHRATIDRATERGRARAEKDKELREYLEGLGEEKRDVCLRYIEEIAKQIGWGPASFGEQGIFYHESKDWEDNQANIDPRDGAYSIYATDSIDGTAKEGIFERLMAEWSAELSPTGQPAER